MHRFEVDSVSGRFNEFLKGAFADLESGWAREL
jgi:hypothetical protein